MHVGIAGVAFHGTFNVTDANQGVFLGFSGLQTRIHNVKIQTTFAQVKQFTALLVFPGDLGGHTINFQKVVVVHKLMYAFLFCFQLFGISNYVFVAGG